VLSSRLISTHDRKHSIEGAFHKYQTILELMESHHVEYSSRFESLETALTSLHVAASKSSMSEPVQPFQVRNVKHDFLVKLIQSGSVHFYYREFTALANRTQGITADVLLDCFLNGLKIDIEGMLLLKIQPPGYMLFHWLSFLKRISA